MTKYLKHFLFVCALLLSAGQAKASEKAPFVQKFENWHREITTKAPPQSTDSDLYADFGSVLLTSCSTSVRKTGPTYLGAVLTSNKGWKIRDINIQTGSDPVVPIELFHPFKQPFQQEQIYPISALPPQNEAPVTFYLTGNLTACQTEVLNPETQQITPLNPPVCTVRPINLKRTLKGYSAELTPECSGITLAMALTPIPMHMNRIKGWAVRQNETEAKLTLDFNQNPKTLMIYNEEKQPQTLTITMDKKRAEFMWPITENQQQLRLFARTAYHYYEILLPIRPPNELPPPVSLPFSAFWQACLWTLLFSSLPIFWARYTDNTKKQFLNQTKLMIGLLLAMALALALWISTTGALPLDKMLMSKGWTIGLMLAGLLLIPMNALIPIALWIIAPKPFLADITTTSAQLELIFAIWLISSTLFALQLIYAKKIVPYLKNPKEHQIWWCSRLAWIGLILYTFVYL